MDIEGKRFFVFAGPGGVGKTTLSACFALAVSEKYRTLVITVDPAKRLKDAFRIEINKITEVSQNLWATQIDARRDFDEFLVERAPELRTLVENPLYSVAAGMLPSEEYIAFARVVELASRGDWEKIVIDTPPSSKFFSFLQAPEKILSLFRTGSVRVFLEVASRGAGALGGALRGAGKMLGVDFMVNFAKFLSSLRKLFSVMQEISEEALALFKSRQTSFFVVTLPSQDKVQETIKIVRGMEEMGFYPSAIFINRFFNFTPDGIHPNSHPEFERFQRELAEISERMKRNVRPLENFARCIFVDEVFEGDVLKKVATNIKKSLSRLRSV